MYLDFDLLPETTFETDICIIGSGAAGFACAVSLLPSAWRVLVLEGGEKTYDPQAADLHRGVVSNLPHAGLHEARERIVGGTTTKWGGQVLPFMAEDFQYRPHVEHSGWPLTKAELAPYYQQAEAILGTDATTPTDHDFWQARQLPTPAFSADSVQLITTKWCKIPNFAQQHGAKIAQSSSVHLLSKANAVELMPGAGATAVQEIRIASLAGKRGTVRARYVIAAGGAIETCRLFLASTGFGPAGLGNGQHLVGRYFQDHVAAVVGQLLPASRPRLQAIFSSFYQNGFKYFPRLRLSAQRASQLGVLHASAQLLFTDTGRHALTSLKQVASALRRRQKVPLAAIRQALQPAYFYTLAKAALRWQLLRRGSFPSTGPVWLEVHSEQAPTAESYVALTEQTDALQLPRVRLHWTVADATIATLRTTAALLKEEFERSGLGQVQLEPWVTNPACEARPLLGDTYHQAGGLRMAHDPAHGVVDAQCKVFGLDNLYVASSAVFPTSSFSNPTMTIIALAIRVSEEVSRQLAQAQPAH